MDMPHIIYFLGSPTPRYPNFKIVPPLLVGPLNDKDESKGSRVQNPEWSQHIFNVKMFAFNSNLEDIELNVSFRSKLFSEKETVIQIA